MSNDAYDVGFKRPPKHTRFKKGQSGNPNGRPQGSKNFSTDLREELEEIVTVTEGGKTREIPKQRMLIKAQVGRAAKGDTRAARFLLENKHEDDLARSARDAGQRPPDEDDQAVIRAFLTRREREEDADS